MAFGCASRSEVRGIVRRVLYVDLLLPCMQATVHAAHTRTLMCARKERLDVDFDKRSSELPPLAIGENMNAGERK